MGGEFFSFPWQVQIALASGYAAYLTAYAGMRASHDTTETVFRTIIFSFVASSLYAVFTVQFVAVASAAFAFFGTLIVAALWRRFGCELWRRILHGLRISHADDAPSALAALARRTDVTLTGISVLLDDDTWLKSDDTSLFAKCTHTPVSIGQDGDIAMYVASIKKGESEKTLTSTVNKKFGDRLTYVPANRVKRVNLRFRRDD